MGTIISLGIGKFEIDWGKNNYFQSHCNLFQQNDFKKIPYYYFDGVEEKMGYSAPIAKIKKRLDLLGFNLEKCKKEYCQRVEFEDINDYYHVLTFDEFYTLFTKIDIDEINVITEENDCDFDLGEYVREKIFESKEIKKQLPFQYKSLSYEWYENLAPEIILRVLCENPTVQDKDLTWYVADVLEDNYITEEDIKPKLDREEKFLLVTEGSSDTNIIKLAFNYLFPEVSDFFDFIDMTNNYPFGGTGQLCNFAKGLNKINVMNKILVIFDNDAAGLEKYDECIKSCSDLSNLKFYHLPDLEEFNEVLTVGPGGESKENINGKAVAIENYLDYEYKIEERIKVRWKNYVEKTGTYHGAIENKEKISKIFFNNYQNPDYNLSKLKFLLEDIIKFCCVSEW